MNFRMKAVGLSLIASAVLVACGGGGSGDAVTPAAAPTAAGAATTLTALGSPAAVTAANSTSTAYDVVAAIGDTWRIEFDTTGNAYRVTVVKTQYGLANTSGTFTSTTSGNYTTYTLSGAAGTLVVDKRTKALAGNMTIGAKTSTVAGTGYTTPALAKLAGTYNFAYNTRNASNGQFRDVNAGQFAISTDGASIAICVGGTINTAATACATQLPGASTTPETGTLARATDGKVTVAVAGVEFAQLHVQVGDRGPIVLMDRYGLNQEKVMRTGAFYAAKATTLAGTEFNGTWTCNRSDGTGNGTAVISGTTGSTKGGTDTSATSVNLYYNQVYNGSTSTTLSVPGFLSIGSSLANSGLVLPLSSSLAVAASGNGTDLSVCSSTN